MTKLPKSKISFSNTNEQPKLKLPCPLIDHSNMTKTPNSLGCIYHEQKKKNEIK